MNTIAAIATAIGSGGIGIIRLSGPASLYIALSLLDISSLEPRKMMFVKVNDPDKRCLLDEGCCVYFKGPFSYTGEDVVEFHLHASSYILKRVLDLLIEKGAVLAQAGEFTKRAFLNGKLTLEQAEAVGDLIASEHEFSHAVAMNHLQGALFKRLATCKKICLEILAHIEGSIDFPDEVPAINREEVSQQLLLQHDWIKQVLAQQDFGRILKKGVKCLIVGRPNVGKSTLFNTLVGESRALVSNQAGTTRDYIDVTVMLQGTPFHFIDTAGIHDSDDFLEQEGIAKLDALIQKADICIWVENPDWAKYQEQCAHIESLLEQKDLFLVMNKCEEMHEFDNIHFCKKGSRSLLKVSAKNQQGLDTLKEALLQFISDKKNNFSEDLLCSLRQEKALQGVDHSLTQVMNGLKEAYFDDLLSIDLKMVIQFCDDIGGEGIHEEVLDFVFSKFCVGK